MKASNPSTCLSPGTLALTLVSQLWEQLPQTPQNVVIVVISFPQQELGMTTFFEAEKVSKQLSSPSTVTNGDAFFGL